MARISARRSATLALALVCAMASLATAGPLRRGASPKFRSSLGDLSASSAPDVHKEFDALTTGCTGTCYCLQLNRHGATEMTTLPILNAACPKLVARHGLMFLSIGEGHDTALCHIGFAVTLANADDFGDCVL